MYISDQCYTCTHLVLTAMNDSSNAFADLAHVCGDIGSNFFYHACKIASRHGPDERRIGRLRMLPCGQEL